MVYLMTASLVDTSAQTVEQCHRKDISIKLQVGRGRCIGRAGGIEERASSRERGCECSGEHIAGADRRSRVHREPTDLIRHRMTRLRDHDGAPKEASFDYSGPVARWRQQPHEF